jgi:hypothetical protein
MRDLNKHTVELKKALPRLVFGMSLIFVTIQGGLATIHAASNLLRAHHSR